MELFDNLLTNVEKQIELIIRGGSTAGQNPGGADNGLLFGDVRELFHHLTSDSLLKEAADIGDKTAMVNAAVRLHNKVRNLSPTVHAELRAVAKACAAWILMLFNQPVPKSLCAVIKLLSRAGQETQPFADDIALKCCTAATSLWKRINIQTLSQMMPSLELQDIKIAVFQTYLDKANILARTDIILNCSEGRVAITGAFDIVQSLPEGLKIHFAEQTVALGAKFSSLGILEEAVYLLQIAISSIDILAHSVGTVSMRGAADEHSLSLAERDELQNLKMKAQLSLSFALKEMNQCDKAMANILAVESALMAQIGQKGNNRERFHQNMIQTLAYAKFNVLAKEGDWDSAELSLKVLLTNAPYELGMDVIRIFLEGHEDETRSKGVELYRIIANKFPLEPNFTNTRICLVEYILSNAQLHDNSAFIGEVHTNPIATGLRSDENSCHRRVAEICGEILADHLAKKRRLSRSPVVAATGVSDVTSASSFERFKRILSQRVRWNRANGTWESVILWVDLLLKLLYEGIDRTLSPSYKRNDDNSTNIKSSSMENDDKTIAQLQKVDALLHIGQSNEALAIALTAVQEVCVTRTIVMAFLATLHAKGSDHAVRTLLQLQEGGVSDVHSRSEYLSMIMICAEVTKDAVTIPVDDREDTLILLLSSWLTRYSTYQAWRLEMTDENTGEAYDFADSYSVVTGTSVNYLAVACEVVCRYLKQNLLKTRRDTHRTSTSHDFSMESIKDLPGDNRSLPLGDTLALDGIITLNRKRLLSKQINIDEETYAKSDHNKTQTGTMAPVIKNCMVDDIEGQKKRSKETHEKFEMEATSTTVIVNQLSEKSALNTVDNAADTAAEKDILSSPLLSSPPSFKEISYPLKPHKEEASAHTEISCPKMLPYDLESALAATNDESTDGEYRRALNFKSTSDPIDNALDMKFNLYAAGGIPEGDDGLIKLDHATNLRNSVNIVDNTTAGSDGESMGTCWITCEPSKIPSDANTMSKQTQISMTCQSTSDTIQRLEVVTPLKETASTPQFLNGNSYTSLCGYPPGILKTKKKEQNLSSTFAFSFKTSLLDVKSLILGLLKDLLAAHRSLSQDGADTLLLGSFADLEWLGDFAWNMGCIMVSEHYCESLEVFEEIPVIISTQIPTAFDSINTDEGSTLDLSRGSREVRLAGAEFLEASAELYALVPFSDKLIGLQNQSMCLVLACSARLDAATLEDMVASQEQLKGAKEQGVNQKVSESFNQGNESVDSDSGLETCKQKGIHPNLLAVSFKNTPATLHILNELGSESIILLGAEWMEQNLILARNAAARANSLLASQAGFDDDNNDTRSFLKKVALVLEFSALCKLRSEDIMHFVGAYQMYQASKSKESEFLSLSAPQLKTCADIACSERGGTVEIARRMLNYSLQICQRDSMPDHELMGMLFRKLIELSPSRRDALDRVRHFERLASGQAYSGSVSDDGEDCSKKSSCPFDSTDVDYIASISFNYGLSLVDISQIDLAEIFVSKALSLLPHASTVLQGWKERMQDTYVAVLKAKEEYHRKERNYTLNINSIGLTAESAIEK